MSPPAGRSGATSRSLLNAILFYAAWTASVLGAARGAPMAGPAAVAIALALHLFLVARNRRVEVVLAAAAAAAGVLLDGALLGTGAITFVGGDTLLPPPWMIALWALFATTIRTSLLPLERRPALAALLGAVSGPLSYAAGARAGAIRLGGDPVVASILIAAVWAVATPGLVALGRRLDAAPP